MLRFFGEAGDPRAKQVVALPAAFNPPTIAHLSMARIAAGEADEVLLVLPERMPHKPFEGASYEQRLRMLAGLAAEDRYRVCSVTGGLFGEIAGACREAFPEAEIAIACGRDAAERAIGWRYAEASALDTLFGIAELWVFARQGQVEAPERWRHRVRTFAFDEDLQRVSATEVRRGIASGEAWRHLVPEAIHALVEEIYEPGDPAGYSTGGPPCKKVRSR